MANAYLQQFFFSFNHQPVYIEANAVIDSGQPSGTRSLKGGGVKSIVKKATGIYQVTLTESFNRYLGGTAGFVAGVTGNVASTALTVGVAYVIRTVGSTNWQTAGLPAGVTAAPGVAFVATATSAGTGTAFTTVPSGVAEVEVLGDPNLSITNFTNPYFIIACYDYAGALVAPVDGSVLGLTTFVRNSSVKGKGE